jgi:Rrf2 family nitric oxide-sensitive transcriptional repressor
MNLTKKTDLAIRLLVYFADRGEQGSTSAEAAEAHGLSPTHTAKILRELSAHDWVETSRGRGSRARLIADADELRIGDVVRRMEPFELAECFNPTRDSCRLTGHCKLRAQLEFARRAFLESLDEVCIADLQTAHSRKLAEET